MTKQYKSIMWNSHIPVVVRTDWFECNDKDLSTQPIFVLDEDPILCARALVTEHLKKYMDYIAYSCIEFRASETIKMKSDVRNKPRVNYMFYNQRTAYWFYQLYTEMQTIYKNRFGKYYKVSEYFKSEWINDMTRITGPKHVKDRAHKGMRLPNDTCIRKKYMDIYQHYKGTIDKVRSRTGRFRVMYMLLGYIHSEFPNGAPPWYSSMKATIWKSYNKMTRLYYRIDTTIEGKYSYYYSVDDKNWIEIQNIPMDLRGLIDGIIFAREV